AALDFENPRSLRMTGNFDSLTIPDDASLKPAAVTVSAWVRLNALTSNATSGLASNTGQYFVFKRNSRIGQFEGYSLHKYGATFRFCVSNAAGTQGEAFSTTNAAAGVWYHLVGTFEKPNVRLYVNGRLESTVAHNFDLDYGARPLFIGRTGEDGEAGEGNWDADLNGWIDDVRIYSRALSAAEISNLARGRQSGTASATYTLAGPLTVAGDLTLNSGTLDVSASNHAVNVAGSWMNHGGRFAPRSGTVTLNGTAAGKDVLSGSQAFNDLTVNGAGGGWTARDTLPVGGHFLQSNGTLTAPSGRMEVAGNFTKSGGTFTPNGGTLFLRPSGARTLDTGGTALHRLTVNDGLAAYWKFDEAAGTSADVSGYGLHGTATNGAAPSASVPTLEYANPRSMQFDGTNDYVDAGRNVPLLRNASAATISAWVRVSDTTVDRHIVAVNAGSGQTLGTSRATLIVKGTGFVRAGGRAADAGPSYTVDSAAGTVAVDTWTHLAATINYATGQVQIFKNGIRVANGTGSFAPATATSDTNAAVVTLGCEEDAATGFMIGQIDDVRIYSRVLTVTEVAALAAGEAPRTGSGSVALGADLSLGDDLTIHSGTLNAGARAVAVSGSWLNYGGIFAGGTSTVTLNAATAEDILCGGQPFQHLTLDGSGAWSAPDPLLVNGTFTQLQGTLNAPSSRMEVGGNVARSGGTFNPNGGTLLLRPAGATTFNSGGAPLNHVALNDGLVGHWTFDDAAGTTAADASGHGRTATLIGAPTWEAANKPAVNFNNPSALSFNGTGQAGGVRLDLSGTNVVSVAFWLYWDAYANDDRLALEFGTSQAPGQGFNELTTGFLIDPNSASFPGQFEVAVKGNAGYQNITFARPSAAAWHHYVIVFDKSVGGGAPEVIPYVDGAVAAFAQSGVLDNTNNFGNDTLWFMSRGGSLLLGAGKLDDVRVYRRALTAAEVAALAAGNQPGTAVGAVTLQAPVTVGGDLRLNAGTLNAGTHGLALAGNWLNHGALFNAGTGTVTLTSGGAGTRILSGGQSFLNLAVTGTGGWSLSDPVTVAGAYTQDAGTVTVGRALTVAGNASVNDGELALVANGQVRLASGRALTIGDGDAVPARLSASGATKPRITTSGTPGTHFYGFTVNADATLAVTALEVFSTNASGLTVDAGATFDNGTAGAISGVDFDRIQASGTYLRFLGTAGSYAVSGCTFGNTGSPNPFNIATPAGAAAGMVDATAGNGGARSGESFENDRASGTDPNPATSSINWSTAAGAPSASSVDQYRATAGTAIAAGGATPQDVTFKATASDPDGQVWRLDVEVRLAAAAFTGTATHTSAFVA
ncbi:MAG TPA: LamG domain-containing protein, partial [Planctomycetota bacterium]|nr:LamG domain-containing protein [Planctomycetota bacterium]